MRAPRFFHPECISMEKAIIKLSFRQIADQSSVSSFEKELLRLSYEEYKMKQQAYNADGRIQRFTELCKKDGRAHSLHYKAGFAVAGLIGQLDNKLSILQDGIARPFAFSTYRFEIIESDISDFSRHKIAVHYISFPLVLLATIGNNLLLAPEDKWVTDESSPSFLLPVQPGMDIIEYKALPVATY